MFCFFEGDFVEISKWGKYLCFSFIDGEIGFDKDYEVMVELGIEFRSFIVYVLGFIWCFWKWWKCNLVWKEIIIGDYGKSL